MQIKNAMKNSFFGMLGQVALIVVGFFCQRTMNLLMGAELVGMNGVISNVIAILSVSELGISTAVVYNLYAAIAGQDENRIAGLMNLYRKAYLVFAAVILGLGMAVMPFIHLILNEVTFSLGYIRLVFFLWLVRTVLSYLLSYKRSILIADQREYLVSITMLVVNVLNYTSTIVILELSRNYVLALGINIVVEAAGNLWIAAYVDRKYPFLARLRKAPLEQELVGRVVDNIRNIFVTRLFTKLLLSTDKIIASGMITTVVAGLYTNYCLITQSVLNIMVAFAGALKPMLGHLFLEKDRDKDVRALRQITFLFFLVSSAASVCVFCLITPFVKDLWLNETYLMEMSFVAASVGQFFFTAMGLPLESVMSVTGLFHRERNVAIITTLVNLAVSLLLVGKLGVAGIAIGTITAYLVQIGCRMKVFFREYVKQSAISYLADLAQYTVVTVAETALIYPLTKRIYSGGIFSFLVITVTAAALALGADLLLYCRSWKLRSVLGLAREAVRHGDRRRLM